MLVRPRGTPWSPGKTRPYGKIESFPLPGPQFKNLTDSGSVESPYYAWVDRFDTLGLGKDVPIATGNENEGLLAMVPGTGKTFGEMPPEEKRLYSHRARAVRALLESGALERL